MGEGHAAENDVHAVLHEAFFGIQIHQMRRHVARKRIDFLHGNVIFAQPPVLQRLACPFHDQCMHGPSFQMCHPFKVKYALQGEFMHIADPFLQPSCHHAHGFSLVSEGECEAAVMQPVSGAGQLWHQMARARRGYVIGVVHVHAAEGVQPWWQQS